MTMVKGTKQKREVTTMYSMKHFTVKSTAEAWKLVNEIFPTDYIQNDEYTVNAGYPVYESTSTSYPNAYIRDLCVRFEINVGDDEWYTIWIEEDEETETTEETAEAIEAEADEENAEPTTEDILEATAHQNTFSPENALIIRFHVMGYSFEADAEQRVYRALARRNEWERSYMAFDLCEAYCKNQGIEWKTMQILSVQHFPKQDEGHFVITGLVSV